MSQYRKERKPTTDTLLIIDMLPAYGLLCCLLVSICVTLAFHWLARACEDRRQLRFAVITLLIGSLSVALLAGCVYTIAMPYAQPDMVDFYRTYRPAAFVFLTGLFCVQSVFGAATVQASRNRHNTGNGSDHAHQCELSYRHDDAHHSGRTTAAHGKGAKASVGVSLYRPPYPERRLRAESGAIQACSAIR
ncbi:MULTISPECIES: hypothetical protein [unclassified Bifidobacterium]|uniref:hypothetical protein n=1 Tax=unclassified Bifidobacterium TaxID=2608897 RepID=UPI001DA07360|nr:MULTISPECIES: hypothetical protein [unclassified Bifidobacterium]TPF78270.1 hypothetical protein BW09_05465 [Bifidobacterium sp. UTCIF-1]TPF79712.1 hypothetical protein BW08_08585 [Bifidobacterium sp. UTCIF-24]TPF82494.1 hypothetical protein BW12_04450 [Bifidobacterium sp. UTCIF-3]TPF84136.1 hypothetical protein BW07_06415 [Bifidobacterium sp. UTCIF-36]TPF89380.1 hypothetical protein BW10_06680 [Bifidobacterium sp. UTBIF-56]